MGLEYRNFILLAGKEELKKRHAELKKIPKTKSNCYLPHEAFLADYRDSEEELLFFPHDKETEVRFIDANDRDGPLSVRHVIEKTDNMCEKYGPELESENVRDMVELLESVGNPIPSKLTTVKFIQNQRRTTIRVDDKKVKLEYSKIIVVVDKAAHGRGNAGTLSEEWVTVSARGPTASVESIVASLSANCKALAAKADAGGSSSSPSSAPSFPSFIESGYAEFVSLMAARVKPPPIPMMKRKASVSGEGDDDAAEKKSTKQKSKNVAGAAAAAVTGVAGVMKGAADAVAESQGPSAQKAKDIQKTLETIDANLKAAALANGGDLDSDDEDDKPILKFFPEKKKPGPKSKREKEEIAAAEAAAMKLKAAAEAAKPPPAKEKKKPGPKSKKEKEVAAKVAEAAAAVAPELPAKDRKKPGPKSKKDKEAAEKLKEAALKKEASDSDSDSEDDKPISIMVR